MMEIVAVVWPALAVGHDCRNRRPAPTSSTCTLLIVLSLWRHVAQTNGNQGTDIHPNFHRRRATQDINRAFTLAEHDVLEPQLKFLSCRMDDASILLRELRRVLLGADVDRTADSRERITDGLAPEALSP